MSVLPAGVPKSALYDFTALFVPPDTPIGTTVELVITISEHDLNVREFGAYLSLADRVYGRLTEAGLKSYAQSAYDQLRITEIRKGSVELIIAEAVSHFQDATPLVILWLFLRYVPGILQSASEASKNVADAYRSLQEGKLVAQNRKQLEVKSLSEVTKSYADAYKSLEEGKLARQNRKRLKQEMKQDQSLQDLNTKRLNQLVLLLDDLQIDV